MDKKKIYEVNFDGLVGPSHNFAGLSWGNVASTNSKSQLARPKAAALQGLKKMKFLHDLGIKQAVFPPHERPNVHVLRGLGFTGSDHRILEEAYKKEPSLFASICSSSSMWAANAAIVSASADTLDHKVHFTPANLASNFHRSIETQMTADILKSIFKDKNKFVHHCQAGENFSDEGAANHNRFCVDHGAAGLNLFVFGKHAMEHLSKHPIPSPKVYPARQSFEAFKAITSLHQLPSKNVIFAQQNPDVIDQGVFHNDVISVANENVFFYHEESFVDTDLVVNAIDRSMRALSSNSEMHFIKVKSSDFSVDQAVKSYIFNSQLLSLGDGSMILLSPIEVQGIVEVEDYVKSILAADNPIKAVHYFNLKESMLNGGGPACLRLRVVLNQSELLACKQSVFLNNKLYNDLKLWIEKHYPDELQFQDLRDPQRLDSIRVALDELTQILGLGSLYEFQKI